MRSVECRVCSQPLKRGMAECPQCGCPVPRPAFGLWQALLRLVVVCILIVLLVPGIKWRTSSEPDPQMKQRLRQIGLALQAYHDAYDRFPPAWVADASGKPAHSWRVLLLPYLGEKSLYASYRFQEPWDGPRNRQLLSRIPEAYRSPLLPAESPWTAVAAVVGPLCVMKGDTSSSKSQIPNPADTALMGEVVAEIPWTKPEDVPYAYKSLGSPGYFGSRLAKRGASFVTAAGTVVSFPREIEETQLRFWFTREDEPSVPPPKLRGTKKIRLDGT